MKRLIANHVSPEMHEEVNEHIEDTTFTSRWLKQQSTEEYLLAKKIVNFLPIAPTNNLIYKIYFDLKNGKYKNLNNFEDLLNEVRNTLILQGILIDYLPDNKMKYEHINDAFTKNV